MVERLGITIFYTAPTAIRAYAPGKATSGSAKYDRSSLRILGTVGEPINPEAWRWYHNVVGEGRCPVVDTWWQTETGGILISPLPGATPLKPGSATLPFFGIEPVVLDDKGAELAGNGVSGAPGHQAALAGHGPHHPWRPPALRRHLLRPFPGYYFTGDGCRRDEDGYYWITGRVDDVINVSGHRLGTAEVESALVAHQAVAEAAVVGYPHDDQGPGHLRLRHPERRARRTSAGADRRAEEQVRHAIGPFATPGHDPGRLGPAQDPLGKIMRRILRKHRGEELPRLGDTSTLADPTVVEALIAKRESM